MTEPSRTEPSEKDVQTNRSFQDKWFRNPSLALHQTLDPSSNFQQWILQRNGWNDAEAAKASLAHYARILDAGCGNGRVTALLGTLAPHAQVVGVDQADVAPAHSNTAPLGNVTISRGNLREPLDHLGRFDFVYCQEVLHHTGDPVGVFMRLAGLLAARGTIAIYVYRQKAPAREYMDDFIRARIAQLPYEEAMQVCRKITELGRRLSAVAQTVEVDDIPELGIEKGSYTPQRLLYNFFLKCYWSDQLTYEENAVINYDWYHPQHCSRHTLEEVLGWFEAADLDVAWKNQDLYGVTVHGRRR